MKLLWRKRYKQGLVAGAALDVFTDEPLKNSPLTTVENIILTPHIAGSTNEAQEAVGYQIAMQVKEYLKHGVIQNAVNVPSVSHDEYLELQPYVVLAERLGSFLAQVSEGTLEEISLRYTGHMAESKTDLIRNAAVKGILNEALEEKANLVNAEAIASSRGLRIHESRKPHSSGAVREACSRCCSRRRTASIWSRAQYCTKIRRGCCTWMELMWKRPSSAILFTSATATFPESSERWARFWANTRSISRTSPSDAGRAIPSPALRGRRSRWCM